MDFVINNSIKFIIIDYPHFNQCLNYKILLKIKDFSFLLFNVYYCLFLFVINFFKIFIHQVFPVFLTILSIFSFFLFAIPFIFLIPKLIIFFIFFFFLIFICVKHLFLKIHLMIGIVIGTKVSEVTFDYCYL